jgi:hypothetical protein
LGALKDMVPMGEKSQKRNSKLQRIFIELWGQNVIILAKLKDES